MPTRYYRKNKERLQKEAHERYQNLSEEEKTIRKYGREQYKKFSEDQKKKKNSRIVKKYYAMRKNNY